MRRVTREELHMRIAIGLKVARPHKRRMLGLDTEDIINQVTDDIVHRIMGQAESEAVIVEPDQVGGPHSPRPGRWGEDEPHPLASHSRSRAIGSDLSG